MNKITLFLLLFILVLVTVIADIYKRSQKGIPDLSSTGIRTEQLGGKLQVGAASVDITPYLVEDKSSALLSCDLDKLVNPSSAIPEDEEPPKKNGPKFLNKFFLKSLVIKGKKGTIVLITIDIASLRPIQLSSLFDRLKSSMNLDDRFVRVSLAGLSCQLTLPAQELALQAEKCVRAAFDNCQAAEFTVIQASDPLIAANDNRIDIPDVGTQDVPPLCGPLTGRVYDASSAAKRWLFTLDPDTNTPISPLYTRDAGNLPISLLLFRSSQDHYIGGLVIVPLMPLIAPNPAIRDYSTDYIFPLCSYLEKKMPGVYLFLRSPGENIVPTIDNFSSMNAQRMGQRISSALLSGLKKAEWSRIKKGFGYFKPLRLPLHENLNKSSAELLMSYERFNRESKALREVPVNLMLKRQLQDKTLASFYHYKFLSDFGKPGQIAIKALRINDWLFVSLPGGYLLKTEPHLHPETGDKMIITERGDATLSTILPTEDFNGGYLANSSIFSPAAEGLVREEVQALKKAVLPKETP